MPTDVTTQGGQQGRDLTEGTDEQTVNVNDLCRQAMKEGRGSTTLTRQHCNLAKTLNKGLAR